MAEQPGLPGADWERQPLAPEEGKRRTRANNHAGAMIGKFGRGPEGRKCRDCVFLKRTGGRSRRYYLKCLKYGVSHGEGTDWRAKWSACRLFKERMSDGKDD